MRSYFYSLILLYFLFNFVNAKVEEKQSKIKEKQSNSIDEEEKIDEKVDFSHGYGTDIDWVQWNEAVSIALDLNKPIFLLIHKTWCGACQALKKSFASSNKREELIELSKQFVMVNVEDDDEPEEEEYAPDGRYIPRLFILNKEGHPLEVDNSKNYPNNKQYFPQVPDVIRAMKLGLKKFEGVEEEDKIVEEGKEKKDEKVKEKELKVVEILLEDKEKDKTKKEDKKKQTGGCPHASGKAAKKAEEEAKTKKTVKDKNVETKKENDKKVKEKVKDGGTKKDGGAKKEKTAEKTKKSKEDKEKPKKTEKKKKEKEEL
ncbi:hypothetical protein ACQ4LE_003386 [Meloidogyne hapla]|uniref:Thioredoxin domain-containing protein n=1 Tax=Meloidogyne hapla TaxID=6305 RepID=A0A1I8BLU7_MELHA